MVRFYFRETKDSTLGRLKCVYFGRHTVLVHEKSIKGIACSSEGEKEGNTGKVTGVEATGFHD